MTHQDGRDDAAVYLGVTFVWDSAKAASNYHKHSVTFGVALTAFGDPLSTTVGDPDHSNSEQRLVLLGMTSGGTLVVVVHTERGENRIRLISARPATKRERQEYENG